MEQKSVRIFLSLCLGLFLGFWMAGVQAQGSKPKIRVGYSNFTGFLERDERIKDGYSGYAYDYLHEIARYTGWEYEFVYGTWEECCARLKSGEIDLLGMLQETKDRGEVYAYGRYPCGIEFTMLYVQEDARDVYYEDFAAFSKLRFGLVRGFYQNGSFEAYARRHGFSPETRYYASSEALQDALRRGEVDAAVESSLERRRGGKLVAKFGGNPFYFAAPKAKEAIIRALDDAVERMQLEKPYLEQHLFAKYYGNMEKSLNLRREEAAFIAGAPNIRVAADPNFAPYSVRDAGEAYAGVFNDVLHKLFGRLGLGHTPVRAPSFGAAAARVRVGDADILAAVYPSSAFGKAYGMKFTRPYMMVRCLLVGRRGMNFHEKGPMQVAVTQDHLGMRHYIEERYPYWSVKQYETTEACLRAVRSGAADISLQTADSAMPILLHRPYGDIVPILTVDAEIPVSIGVSERAAPLLLDVLDKAVATVHAQEINESILRHTVGRAERMSWRAFLRANVLELFCLAALLFVLALTAIVFAKRRKNAALAKIAYTDHLTGARNMKKFELDVGCILAQRCGRWALAYFDIEKFRFINETLGYARGNEVLRCFAQLLARRLQEGELFARISDDRFVALLRLDDEAQMRARLEAFCGEFGRLRSTLLENQRLVLAVGVYVLRAEDGDIDAIVDRANLARKTVKGACSHSIAFYDGAIHAQVLKEKQIEGIMDEALQRGEFHMYLQPKYALGSGAVVGAEALVRWYRPDGSVVSPADFVPIFERNGFVVELDFYMFEAACQRLRQWLQSGRPIVPIAVNFSRLHLGDAQFADELRGVAARYGVEPRWLEVEMTESAFVEDAADAAELISRIKEAGFVLTMDDFGTGYSSLNLLREVPFDVLKLDKTFLMNKEATQRDRIMLSNIVRMAKELDIRVVAEGIETQEQQDFVRETGCDMGQGYFFAKPMPVEAFEARAWSMEKSASL